MEKTITFNIPKGYVIDKENSTDNNIVLKLDKVKLVDPLRPKTWEEFCWKIKDKDSYYFNNASNTIEHSHFVYEPVITEFDNKEDVETFAAFSKLIKLRKYWVGDWKPDWANNYQKKYIICNYSDIVAKDTMITASHSLSFPTAEMRDEFFDCFKDLLEKTKELI